MSPVARDVSESLRRTVSLQGSFTAISWEECVEYQRMSNCKLFIFCWALRIKPDEILCKDRYGVEERGFLLEADLESYNQCHDCDGNYVYKSYDARWYKFCNIDCKNPRFQQIASNHCIDRLEQYRLTCLLREILGRDSPTNSFWIGIWNIFQH